MLLLLTLIVMQFLSTGWEITALIDQTTLTGLWSYFASWCGSCVITDGIGARQQGAIRVVIAAANVADQHLDERAAGRSQVEDQPVAGQTAQGRCDRPWTTVYKVSKTTNRYVKLGSYRVRTDPAPETLQHGQAQVRGHLRCATIGCEGHATMLPLAEGCVDHPSAFYEVIRRCSIQRLVFDSSKDAVRNHPLTVGADNRSIDVSRGRMKDDLANNSRFGYYMSILPLSL
jgi:hypothetical protein